MTTGPQTSIGLFADRARRFPDRPFVRAILRDGALVQHSYLEAAARIAGVADFLLARGYRKGDRLVSYLDEAEPGLWFYMGCAAAGIVPVPLGPSFSVTALGNLAAQCGARALFTLGARVEATRALGLQTFIPDDGPATRIVATAPSDPLARIEALAAGIAPDDLYMLQQTSGSTGVPKLVMRRNVTFPYAGRVLAVGLDETAGGERSIVTGALTHGVGHYALHLQMYLGGCVCLPADVDVSVKIADCERLDPTHLSVVPRVVRALLRAHAEHYGARAADTPFLSPRLKMLSVGGAPSDEKLLAELERRGIAVSEGYGATEISLVAMTALGARKKGWAGRVIPEVDARIADDGEIVVKSPYRMAGYFGDERATAAAFDADGYYHTGDLGMIEDGHLRILGRKRDVFNCSEGSNVYPARIEEMLEGLPAVGQAILVGDGRPFLVALIVPRGATGAADEVLRPEAHAATYAKVGAAIAEINARLESFEQVRRVALLAGPFDRLLYRGVGQGKVARDRVQVLARFAATIGELYAPAADGFAVPRP